MAKQNGKVPGTYVSQDELNDLGKYLETVRTYLVSHEARIELIEGWINEYMEAHAPVSPDAPETETDRAAEVAAENEGLVSEFSSDLRKLADESTDDPEEG